MARFTKTEPWFDDLALEAMRQRYYGKFVPPTLGYATVQDFCDSFDHLAPLATANHDLKDVQRPWVLKSILGLVPQGGRILEIGAGEPWVADLLARLGYQVWVVDPYDGSGNGPTEYQAFLLQCPEVKFIREQFSDQLQSIPSASLDCIYSISVLEHIPPDGLNSVAAGLKKFLKSDGVNLHAIDHVHRGNGAAAHLSHLQQMAKLFGFPVQDLVRTLNDTNSDTETYFLSAESHNRWRGALSYSDFPMRVCISVQFVGRGASVCAK